MIRHLLFLFAAFSCLPAPTARAAPAVGDAIPPEWLAPYKPFRIAGPIHYVGTRGLGVYLIQSSAGLALIGGAMPPSTPLIRASIATLGFKLTDVRLLLVSHAHVDHVGTLAELKKLTGAEVVATAADAELLRSGGNADYLFATRPRFHFAPVTPDRIVADGQVVTFGDARFIAHATPGHTRGCTTWEMHVLDGGHDYDVVFLDGTSVNPGTRLARHPSYPGIASDYRATFGKLAALRPDIFLAYHAEAFELDRKAALAASSGTQAWVDPTGYQRRVASSKATFETILGNEQRK
jgi:metallo-beta-lactamase class B